MGLRGPIAGSESTRQASINRHRSRGGSTLTGLPSVGALRAPEKPPAAPRGLGSSGRAAWRLAWVEAGLWLTDADRPLVERLARLVDELAAFRAALEAHGPVVEEPVVTPRGDVVGRKLVANPAVKQLHDGGVELAGVAAALGLSPASRARLGLKAPARRRRATAGSAESA